MWGMGTQSDFIEWLRHELDSRKWDMAELSRRSGVHTSTLSLIMSEERKPGPTTCRAIARAFHLPVEDVFRHANLLPKSKKLPESAEELLFYYNDLPEDEQKRVLIIVRALYEAQASE